ncbi:DUF1800 domain-containing protein [Roseateles puraquae]|uniref:DUF1800 domain-containing protein n=1 Tax=Roseateles puraquae TaxID=431059 RepID=A0A254N290_9BURK|nr:DUF1800 domain-containing protein [Roseateles puraquae]MDG0857095.1 DUF1800 domain-containing protein [Roseateles puraquae]OWR02306.1 hypothetical protein CDO81_21480 [Roseateles puraquae]
MRLTRFILLAAAAASFVGAARAADERPATPMSEADARRFLGQASFGPTDASVATVRASGRAAWLASQFTRADSDFSGVAWVDPDSSKGCPAGAPATCKRDNYSLFPVQVQFFANAVNQPDQLRQRAALALSEILVVSGNVIKLPNAMAQYQRIFLRNAFGNFRDVLREVTLSPAMGRFLNMANNDKPNPAKGIEPNENYAREVLQLFSIGLWELNPDGSQKLDAKGQPIPSYDQETVEGFAHVFTGWTYAPRPGATRNRFGNPSYYDQPMIAFDDHHDKGSKRLLNGVVLPAGGTAQADLEAAIDNIFNHPNVGPFIGRQLIQQLVTANPSPAYVQRVAQAFNGTTTASFSPTGTVQRKPRGDMKAVLSAILLDPEALTAQDANRFGKLREPILQLTHLLRALGGTSDGVWLRSQSAALGQTVYSPASVFNFFPPDYDLPGDATLDGPAFGVFNASAAFKLSGVLQTLLSGKPVAPDTTVPGATGTGIDLSRWQALAATPATLVAEINRVMFAGRASAALQSALLKAAQIAPDTKPLDRAKAALFLAAMSPEYLVEN